MKITIAEYLQQNQTEVDGVYGHYCALFKIKNNLAADQKIHFSFDQSVKGVSVNFVYDLSDKSFHQLYVKDVSNSVSQELSADDEKFISEVLDVYLARVQKDVNRVTKEIRLDWGKHFKSEIIERSGFTSYFSNLAEIIRRSCRLNLIPYTLSNINRKNAYPFSRI